MDQGRKTAEYFIDILHLYIWHGTRVHTIGKAVSIWEAESHYELSDTLRHRLCPFFCL